MKKLFKIFICVAFWGLTFLVGQAIAKMLQLQHPNDGEMAILYNRTLLTFLATGAITMVGSIWITVLCFRKGPGKK